MVESTAAVEAEVEGWWAGDAEAGADVRTLAAKVAFLRAQRDGVRVELRELTRAFVGARGHGSAAAELEAGSQYARLSAALHKASTGLQLYQARLTSAQQAERSAIDDSRQQAVARRKDEEKQRVEAEKGAADEKSAQRAADTALLLQLMRVGETRIAATGAILPAAADAATPAGPAVGLGDGWVVQNQLLSMMENLTSKLDTMQAKQDAMAVENEKLRSEAASNAAEARRSVGGKAQRRVDAADEDDEEDEDSDARIVRRYHDSAAAVMEALSTGTAPSASAYAERDVQMYRLPDSELQAEYERYTQLYLDERTVAAVRGMAEMTLIKLGEIVDKPQRKRIQMIERAAEEQRAAAQEREREKAKTQKDAAEHQRQNEMNAAAHAMCAPLWRAVAALQTLEGASDATRALAKRLQNRAELQLVVLPSEQVRRLPPGRFTAMGTSGLQPVEVRAVLHALIQSHVQGAPAARYFAMLKEKLVGLPDYVAPTNGKAKTPLRKVKSNAAEEIARIRQSATPTEIVTNAGSE